MSGPKASISLLLASVIALSLIDHAAAEPSQGKLQKLKKAAQGSAETGSSISNGSANADADAEDCDSFWCFFFDLLLTPTSENNAVDNNYKTESNLNTASTGADTRLRKTYLGAHYFNPGDNVYGLAAYIDTGPLFAQTDRLGWGGEFRFQHLWENSSSATDTLNDWSLLGTGYWLITPHWSLQGGLGGRFWNNVDNASGPIFGASTQVDLSPRIRGAFGYDITRFENINLIDYNARILWQPLGFFVGYKAQHATDGPTLEGPILGIQIDL